MEEITENEISQLKQLDRIEYRQKLDYCWRYFGLGYTPWFLITITVLLIIGGFMDDAIIMMQISVIAIIINLVLIFIAEPLVEKKNIHRLNREYFKVVTKK